MYRLITETLLGLERRANQLRFHPRVPSEWKSYAMTYHFGDTVYHLSLVNVGGDWTGRQQISVDGVVQSGPVLQLEDDRKEHRVEMRIGGQ